MMKTYGLLLVLCAPLAHAATTCGKVPIEVGDAIWKEARHNNDTGVIVGGRFYGEDSDGFRDAFVWTKGEVVTLPSLGGNQDDVAAINNSGQVVGTSRDALFQHRAVTWVNGALYTLPDLTPSNRNSAANDINNVNRIVGVSRAADGQDHAVRWSNFKIVDLNRTIGSISSTAHAINLKGQIIGTARFANDRVEAFLFEAGTVQFLGDLGGGGTFALDINDAGQITGSSFTKGGKERAFLWENGVMKSIGTLGGTISWATGINNAGQIVGNSTLATGELRPFRWTAGEMTNIGTLRGGVGGAYGNAININGQVVGVSNMPVDGEGVAWWWKRKC